MSESRRQASRMERRKRRQCAERCTLQHGEQRCVRFYRHYRRVRLTGEEHEAMYRVPRYDAGTHVNVWGCVAPTKIWRCASALELKGRGRAFELAYGRRRRGGRIMPVVLGATLPDSAKISWWRSSKSYVEDQCPGQFM